MYATAMETGFPSYRCGGDDVGEKKKMRMTSVVDVRCVNSWLVGRRSSQPPREKESRVRRRTENFCLNGSPTRRLFSAIALIFLHIRSVPVADPRVVARREDF